MVLEHERPILAQKVGPELLRVPSPSKGHGVVGEIQARRRDGLGLDDLRHARGLGAEIVPGRTRFAIGAPVIGVAYVIGPYVSRRALQEEADGVAGKGGRKGRDHWPDKVRGI